jgi:hypothetical protein
MSWVSRAFILTLHCIEAERLQISSTPLVATTLASLDTTPFSSDMQSRSGARSQLPRSGERSEDDVSTLGQQETSSTMYQQLSPKRDTARHSHPNPPLTPDTLIPSAMPQPVINALLPSAPASPPTPAPSPTPHQRQEAWDRNVATGMEDGMLQNLLLVFSRLNTAGKESWLTSLVDTCDNHSLSFLHQLVSPKLKKDPFETLPNELCFKVRGKVVRVKSEGANNFFRSSNLWTIREHLYELLKYQGDGENF